MPEVSSDGRDRHGDRLVHRAAPGAGGRVQPLVRARPLSRNGEGGSGRVRRRRAVRGDARRARQLRPPRPAVRRSRRAARTSRSRGCCPASKRSGTTGSRVRWRRSRPRAGCSPGRDHVHTAVYRCISQSGAVDAIVALERGFPGAIVVAAERPFPARTAGRRLPPRSGCELDRTVISQAEPPPHELVIGFCARRSARRVRGAAHSTVDACGFASPFLATIPGTDTYTDDL